MVLSRMLDKEMCAKININRHYGNTGKSSPFIILAHTRFPGVFPYPAISREINERLLFHSRACENRLDNFNFYPLQYHNGGKFGIGDGTGCLPRRGSEVFTCQLKNRKTSLFFLLRVTNEDNDQRPWMRLKVENTQRDRSRRVTRVNSFMPSHEVREDREEIRSA